MNEELEKIWKETVVTYSRYYAILRGFPGLQLNALYHVFDIFVTPNTLTSFI